MRRACGFAMAYKIDDVGDALAAQAQDKLLAEEALKGKTEPAVPDPIPGAVNLVTNGDFEELDNDGNPVGWIDLAEIVLIKTQNVSFNRIDRLEIIGG